MINIKRKREKSGKKSFRVRAKNLFLTYPQLPEVDNITIKVLNQLKDILKRDDMSHLIVKELHEDNNPHVHVYLSFSSPIGIYSATKLDLKFGGKTYHGKYESVKDKHNAIQYLLKNQNEKNVDVETNIELPIYAGKYYTDIFSHLHAVLIGEGLDKAIELLYEHYPDDAIKRGTQILNNLRAAHDYETQKHIKKNVKIRGLKDFIDVPKEVINWMEDENRKTLILHGPSGTGKTELAKAILNDLDKNFIFIRDINALKGFSLMTHQAIIFDDLNTEELSREMIIHICDTENASSVRILYGTKDLPAEIDRIFTTNHLRSITKRDDAIMRRVKIIEIAKPLHATVGYQDEPRLMPIEAGPHNNFTIPTTSPNGDNSSSSDDNSSRNGDNLPKQ